MANEQPGLTIRFQGKTCAPEFSYARSVGLEPSRGFVIMEQAAFQDFQVHETLLTTVAGQAPAAGQTVDAGAGLNAGVGVSGLQVAGRLEYIEVDDHDALDVAGDAVHSVVTWENVVVSERAIEAVEADDDGNALCKINLSDIRELWETRGGPISAWINVPKQVDASPSGPGPTASQTGAADAASQALTATANRIQQLERAAAQDSAKIPVALAAVGAAQESGDAVAIATAQQALESALLASQRSTSQFEAAQEVLSLQQDANSLGSVSSKLAETGLQVVLIQGKIQLITDHQIPGAENDLARAQARADSVGIFQATANLQSLRGALAKLQDDLGTAANNFAAEGAGQPPPAAAPPKPTSISSPTGLLIPGSTDAGKPWVLKRVLEVYILPELWGQPKLTYIDPAVGALQVSCKQWDAVKPKKALAELLGEFRLELALNLDSNVSIWKKGEGDLQLADGTKFTHPPFGAITDPRIANAKPVCTFSHVPQAIVVVGAPIIATARVKLEAVGVFGGKIVPLFDALASIGLTPDDAAAFVMQPNERRAALLGVTKEGLNELARWGFKMYRLPGGPEQNSDKLPILDARAAFGSTGELLPLRVFSESHTVISALEAALAGGKGATGFVIEALAQIGKAKTGQYRQAVNVPFGEQASGYTIDTERGTVTFSAPQGILKKPGVGLNEAKLATASLTGGLGFADPKLAAAGFPHVEIEFAYKKRPGLQDNLSLSQRYHSVWARNADGTATQMASLPPGVGALTIERPDFQEVDALDGSSNRGALDAIAKGLVEQRFSVPSSLPGAVVEFCRPVPVINTGKVLSVVWAVNNEVPTVTAHVNNFEKLARAPKSTTDFDTQRLDGVGKGGVFAPKGLT